MPGKTQSKRYERVIFPPEEIKKAEQIVLTTLNEKDRKVTRYNFTISLSSGERFDYDKDEEELFFAEYIKGFEYAFYSKDFNWYKGSITFEVMRLNSVYSEVYVSMPNRADLVKVFNYLEPIAKEHRLPKPTPEMPKFFIGHGHNPQWRDLKDHLHDKHGLDVKTYEIGARAGLTIQKVLEDMLTSSSFAILVFTGEDQDAEGGLHARENVIHELGLFQGRLRWEKAIVLLENGVKEFSNIQGINQIRFSKNNIKETFGEVLATIKREFPWM